MPLYEHSTQGEPIAVLLFRLTQRFMYNALLQLVQGAEAKALYGLVLNYKPLQALVDRLVESSTLTGEQVGQTLEGAGLRYFPDPFVDGFTWGQDGGLVYPGVPEVRLTPTAYATCSYATFTI